VDGLGTFLALLVVGLAAFGLFYGVLLHFSQNATRARLRLIERTFEVERQRMLSQEKPVDDARDDPSA